MAKQTSDTTQIFETLRSEIISGDIKPFYLLFGKEHYFIDELCSAIIEHAMPPEERDFGQVVYYGADVSANQVVNTARQFPMMVQRQLVVVREAQMMSDIEGIGVYFQAMMPSTVLVLCYKTPNDPLRSGKNIDKRTSFYKQACKAGVVFESEQIPDYKMAGWIEGYYRSRGLQISPDGAALLAEFTGSDIQKIAVETDKLIKALPEGSRSVTQDDIAENIGMSRGYSVFELTRALSFKDADKCYRIVRFFASSEKRYPIQMTMAALASHFIKLLRFHALVRARLPRNEILAQLGINPFFAKEYDTAIRNFSVKTTMRAISILKEFDYRSKSNARGNATDGQLLEELTARLLR